MRFGEWQGTKRVILISSVTTWARTASAAPPSEDDYETRQPQQCCAEMVNLENRVLSMDHEGLHSTVVGAGVVYGAGEEALFSMFRCADGARARARELADLLGI